jgi:hypothetical protein
MVGKREILSDKAKIRLMSEGWNLPGDSEKPGNFGIMKDE